MSVRLARPSAPPRSTGILRLAAALLLAICAVATAQTASGPRPQTPSDPSSLPDAPLPQSADPAQAKDKDPVTLRNTPIHILKDQAVLWTSPARVREHDLYILAPLALATTLAISTDHQVMSSIVPQTASFNHLNVTASNGLLGGFVAAPVALFGMGQLRKDEHARETGILGGEAMVDGLVVEEGMKLIFLRERPSVDGAKGKFFQTSVGLDSSFPSTHSMVAWSCASLIASEYPGPLTQLTAYGLATGVSLTRVLGQQHFPSDVLVSSAVGWLIGRYVYHKRQRYSDDY